MSVQSPPTPAQPTMPVLPPILRYVLATGTQALGPAYGDDVDTLAYQAFEADHQATPDKVKDMAWRLFIQPEGVVLDDPTEEAKHTARAAAAYVGHSAVFVHVAAVQRQLRVILKPL